MLPYATLPGHFRPLRSLSKDRRGTTILEFGLIAPSLMALLFGALDVGHTLYMQSILQGAVQKAARDGTLETAGGTTEEIRNAIDAKVRSQLLLLNKSATIDIRRRFYKSFTQAAAAQPEVFYDTAAPSAYHDGICNHGERFDDRNGNGVWDSDGADSVDHAGARDNVVYTVSISYPRMFPIDRLIGGSGTTSMTATTVLSNQPYGDQEQYGAVVEGHCGT
jgi:Flp pilus assembly protein TadG